MKHNSHRDETRSSGAPTGPVRSLAHRLAAEARSRSRALWEQVGERSHRMHEDAASAHRGSRRRGLVAAGAGFVALFTMWQLVAANVLAVNFTTSDNQFGLYSNYLDARYAAGFLSATTRKNTSSDSCTQNATGDSANAVTGGSATSAQCAVAELGINTAQLAGLCAIAHEKLPVIGNVSLMIRSGINNYGGNGSSGGQTIPDSYSGMTTASAGTSVTLATGNTLSVSGTGQLPSTTPGLINANQLFLNSNALSGYGNLISGLNLGQNAADVASYAGLTGGTPGSPGTGSWPAGQTAPTAGNFGLYANQLNVAGLSGSTYGLDLAGNINLPALSIQVVSGLKGQADCS